MADIEHALTASEAGVLACAIDSEVHYLGWLDLTAWSREDFDAAYAKLRALAVIDHEGTT